MARYDDLNTGGIALTTFVGSIVLLLIILLGRALCYNEVNREDARKLDKAHYTDAETEIAAQKARINSYAKVNVEIAPASEGEQPTKEERIHIPLDRAKELLLSELGSKH